MVRFYRVNWVLMPGKEQLRDFLVPFGIAKATKATVCQCVPCENHEKFVKSILCSYLTLKTGKTVCSLHGFFVCFCHCLFDDASCLVDFRSISCCPFQVRQADAESIISAACGSHKALRYQDVLKFFLPEASWDMLMSSVNALSWKALDSYNLPPCESRIQMQVTYDLEDQKSLAKYLEDSNIRLIRAECPPLHSCFFLIKLCGAY